ncbi:peptidoglycan recognition protein family protein [Shimazuella kribbensis]|uniref:peptidoglycan recognition protein family protein n=1 Tax=Shimazuella kribbensis TaxID=139808 RepID=UPI000414A664|nr:N-acetylmuramoyl-L-alanine amidase [Shimazuella kribbensis]
MAWSYGLLFDNAAAFLSYMQKNLSATISACHVHHTYIPAHKNFTGSNHRKLQDGMKKAHLSRGFSTIAQHITIFPDGKIMTGRDVDLSPASAVGYNEKNAKHPFMFEMIGNFDRGNDSLEGKQLESAVKITQHFYEKNTKILFHRELLIDGKAPKSCPGTGVDKNGFMSLVKKTRPLPVPEDDLVVKVANHKLYNRPLFYKVPMLKGNDVLALQERLQIHLDHLFGPNTRDAVIEWQQTHDMRATGRVYYEVWDAMFQHISKKDTNRSFHRNLSYITPLLRGVDISRVQKRLNVPTTGYFGEVTDEAVRLWQTNHNEKGRPVDDGKGLPITGVVDKKTWRALFLGE